MKILFKTYNGQVIDLGKSEKFTNHFKLKTSCAELIAKQICQEKIYDRFLKALPDNPVIFDIGANVGLFSTYCSTIPGVQIVSVEPTPSHFEIMTEVLAQFDSECITPHANAIFYKKDYIPFHISDTNSTMNSPVQCFEHNESKTINVLGITFDILFSQYELIDFVKIDIEGTEKVLIEHNSFECFPDKVKQFFIEIHDIWGADIYKAKKYFESLGYNVSQIGTDGLYCSIVK